MTTVTIVLMAVVMVMIGVVVVALILGSSAMAKCDAGQTEMRQRISRLGIEFSEHHEFRLGELERKARLAMDDQQKAREHRKVLEERIDELKDAMEKAQ